MPNRKKCPTCGKSMSEPEYVKTRVPLPPVTDCPECEEHRQHVSRLTFAKVFACPNCGKVIAEHLTAHEIVENKKKFHWGSQNIPPNFSKKMVEKAKKEELEEKESETLTQEIMDGAPPPRILTISNSPTSPTATGVISESKVVLLLPEKSSLELFMEKVKACPDVDRAYLVEPPQAQQIIELGWTVLELHVVPVGRPPYLAFDKLMGEMETEWEGISELLLIKISEKIQIIPIIENPKHLPHV